MNHPSKPEDGVADLAKFRRRRKRKAGRAKRANICRRLIEDSAKAESSNPQRRRQLIDQLSDLYIKFGQTILDLNKLA